MDAWSGLTWYPSRLFRPPCKAFSKRGFHGFLNVGGQSYAISHYCEGAPIPSLHKESLGPKIVLAKCLKDRQGRVLENPVCYPQIGTAAARTIALRAERETVYQAMEAGRLLETVI